MGSFLASRSNKVLLSEPVPSIGPFSTHPPPTIGTGDSVRAVRTGHDFRAHDHYCGPVVHVGSEASQRSDLAETKAGAVESARLLLGLLSVLSRVFSGPGCGSLAGSRGSASGGRFFILSAAWRRAGLFGSVACDAARDLRVLTMYSSSHVQVAS